MPKRRGRPRLNEGMPANSNGRPYKEERQRRIEAGTWNYGPSVKKDLRTVLEIRDANAPPTL